MQGAAMIVTPLYAAILAALFLLLTLRVVLYRRSARVSLGDGGHTGLQRAMRAHGNFVEYVPLALVMLLILELSHFSLYVIHVLGIVLVIARLLHGYALALSNHSPFGRSAGTVLTVAVLIVEALMCLYQAYRGHIVWLTT
jgi:uncharacterized membrane protein YecN with MAPEG domain